MRKGNDRAPAGRNAGTTSRLTDRLGGRHAGLAAIASLFLAVVLANLSDIAGGSDSSGYLNLSKWLERGALAQPITEIDWFDLADSDTALFVPIGQTTLSSRPREAVAYYPVGLPAQMVSLDWLMQSDRGRFLVAPLAGTFGLLVFYLLARQLGLSASYALAGVTMLAIMPTYLFSSLQPVSDVVATFWGMAALAAALAARRHFAWMMVAGLAFGLGVLVRPTNALLLPALLVSTPLTPRAYLLLGVGGAPMAASYLAFNQLSYGGLLSTGYADAWDLDTAWGFFPSRFEHYIRWLAALLSPLVPMGWLALPFDARVPRRHRWLLLVWFLPLSVFYCVYRHYDAWWYTRFLLPAIPALILASLLVTRHLLDRLRDEAAWFWAPAAAHADRAQFVRGAGIALLAVVLLTGLYQNNRQQVLRFADGQQPYRAASLWATEHLPPWAVMLSVQTSGALDYYTNFVVVRWDDLDPERFERLRAKIDPLGYEWYAMLFSFEQERFEQHVPDRLEYLEEFGPITVWRLTAEAP